MLLYEQLGILLDSNQADVHSANNIIKAHDSVGFFVFAASSTIKTTID